MRSHRIIVRRRSTKRPVVWIIDSEQWPRACLRAELIERGYDAYGFITIGDALDALSQTASPKPESIVLELRGQNVTKQLVEKFGSCRFRRSCLVEQQNSTSPS